MRSMQIESVLQIKNRSEPAKNRFSVALIDSGYLLCTNLPAVLCQSFSNFTGVFVMV